MGRRRPRAARARQDDRRAAREGRRRRPRAGDHDLLGRRLSPGRRRGRSGSGWRSPSSRPRPCARLRELLPAPLRSPTRSTTRRCSGATAAPWRELVRTLGEDPGIGQVLVFYDQPHGLSGAAERVLAGGPRGRDRGRRRQPGRDDRLLDPARAARRRGRLGVRPGRRPGRRRAADRASLRRRDAGARRPIRRACARSPTTARAMDAGARAGRLAGRARGQGAAARPRRRGAATGGIVSGEDDAVPALTELGDHVVLKLSAAAVQHKTELGGVALDLRTADEVRARLSPAGGAGACARRRRAGRADGARRGRADRRRSD